MPRKQLTVKLCTVEGCAKRHRCKGYCRNHYDLYIRYGKPEYKTSRRGEALAFIDELVRRSPTTECITWPFSKDCNGYPCQVVVRGKRVRVLHWILTLLQGDRPSRGHMARHLCGNGHLGCVNPLHLRWGTAQENADDRVEHGRSLRGQAHWKASLTQSEVIEIKRLIAGGMHSQSEIAALFGSTKKTIGGIAQGRVWGWVQP